MNTCPKMDCGGQVRNIMGRCPDDLACSIHSHVHSNNGTWSAWLLGDFQLKFSGSGCGPKGGGASLGEGGVKT